jgi:CRP-like cAMP-binding protein
MSEDLIISNEAKDALLSCELFTDVTEDQIREVAALVEEVDLAPGEVLLRAGDPAEYLFVVIKGRGVAQLEMDRGLLSLGLIGPHDTAGWAALIQGQIYPASVRALTAMRVARLEAEAMSVLMGLNRAVGYKVQKRLSTVFYRQYQAALETFRKTG